MVSLGENYDLFLTPIVSHINVRDLPKIYNEAVKNSRAVTRRVVYEMETAD